MELTLIRELYDYHRWANHRLFDVGVGLGDAVADIAAVGVGLALERGLRSRSLPRSHRTRSACRRRGRGARC